MLGREELALNANYVSTESPLSADQRKLEPSCVNLEV